jgi:hypothetical protein
MVTNSVPEPPQILQRNWSSRFAGVLGGFLIIYISKMYINVTRHTSTTAKPHTSTKAGVLCALCALCSCSPVMTVIASNLYLEYSSTFTVAGGEIVISRCRWVVYSAIQSTTILRLTNVNVKHCHNLSGRSFVYQIYSVFILAKGRA